MFDTDLISFYFADQLQGKGVKRKWEEDEKIKSVEGEQTVPHWINKRQKTELPFSSLLRSMAAKHQNNGTQPEAPNPLLSVVSPMSNPFSRLMAHMAHISQPQNISSEPLDLSSSSEDEVDVDTIEEEKKETPLNQWSCYQVREFIKKIPACRDYAETFYNEKIDGASLSSLTVPQMISYLGINLGQAIEILRRREQIKRS